MADGYLDQVLGWLKGAPSAQAAPINPAPIMAPPLKEYPTKDDAAYARQYGFGYGTGNEPYLDNQRANVLGIPDVSITKVPPAKKGGKPTYKAEDTFIPASGSGQNIGFLANAVNNPSVSSMLDLTDPKNAPAKERLDDVFMRASLAANRSPLATIGFDPSRTVMDVVSKNLNYGGAYGKVPDGIFSVVAPEDAVVHESTHRGIQKLREAYPEQVSSMMKKFPNEETVVRWLMSSTAGDQERGDTTGQRQRSVDYFKGNAGARATLEQLQELAATHRKNQRPGGPR